MLDALGFGRLEDIDRAGDIDFRAQHRVRAAEWHLQRRQMNDMRDIALGENGLHRGGVAQVALNKGDVPLFVGAHQPVDALSVAAGVKVDRAFATAPQMMQRPGAYAAHAARDEIGICHDYASTMRLASLPSPSTSTTYSSPGCSHCRGVMPRMTPSGVPVLMTSPGSSVMMRLA